MEKKVLTSRDLAAQLTHAKLTISACRQSAEQLDVDGENYMLFTISIAMIIRDLNLMQNQLNDRAILWNELRAVNRTNFHSDNARSC